MRIVEITQPGGPEALQISQRPDPAPKAGEVLIRVAAAGVNRADVMQRRGHYPPPKGTVEWPGLEVAGVIESLGPEVRQFAAGDQVCALLSGGGYAELCVAPVAQVLPIPGSLTSTQAAALPEACFTVWSNVFEFCRLSSGESLLVHGGSSGIGVTAIQIAAALGHGVFATAGSADKCRACEALGAKRAINYREEDFVAVVKQATNNRGVNVILDMIGGDYISRDLDCIAEEGRIGVIAAQRGVRAQVDLLRVMQRRAVLTGSMLRPREIAFKARTKAALLKHVWPLIEQGSVRPVIDSVYPFVSTGEAHARMESSDHIGKIVLTW